MLLSKWVLIWFGIGFGALECSGMPMPSITTRSMSDRKLIVREEVGFRGRPRPRPIPPPPPHKPPKPPTPPPPPPPPPPPESQPKEKGKCADSGYIKNHGFGGKIYHC